MTLATDPGEGFDEDTRVELIDPRINAYQIDTEDGRSISGISFKAMGLKPVACAVSDRDGSDSRLGTCWTRVRKLLAEGRGSGRDRGRGGGVQRQGRRAHRAARHRRSTPGRGRATRDEVGHRVIRIDNPYARDKAHLLTASLIHCAARRSIRMASAATSCGSTGSTRTWSAWSCSTPRCCSRPPANSSHVRPDASAASPTAALPPLLAGRVRLGRRHPAAPGGAARRRRAAAARRRHQTALVLRDRSTPTSIRPSPPTTRGCARCAAATSPEPAASDGFASGARADLGAHRLDGRRALPR